jgi:hypothetical protein
MNRGHATNPSSLFHFEKVSEHSDQSVFRDNGCTRCQQCTLQRLSLQASKPVRRLTGQRSDIIERRYP